MLIEMSRLTMFAAGSGLVAVSAVLAFLLVSEQEIFGDKQKGKSKPKGLILKTALSPLMGKVGDALDSLRKRRVK